MAIDTNRLVQIANELKSLDERRDKLLAELQRIAGGGAPAPLSWVSTKPAPAAAPRRRGRPPGSRNNAKPQAASPTRAELVVSRKRGRRKKGLTKAIVDLLQGNGAAYTAGDIVRDLKLPKTKSQISTVSTTLGRLVKQGQVKKDEERGYVAA